MPYIESIPTDPSPYHSSSKYLIGEKNRKEKRNRFNSMNQPESQKEGDLTSVSSYNSPSKKSYDLSAAREKNRLNFQNLFHHSEANRFKAQ